MKYGIREAVDVVFKAKSNMSIGTLDFVAGEPVIYFDSVKTSTTEGATATVYAQGGKGNSRLIAWEGDKTITFTFEDALISTEGLAVLTGAGVLEAGVLAPIRIHQKAILDATVGAAGAISIDLTDALTESGGTLVSDDVFGFVVDAEGEIVTRLGAGTVSAGDAVAFTSSLTQGATISVLVDYYIEKTSDAKEVTITADKFAGYYYIEGDTLFRRQKDGVDLPAQLVIPNAKIQSGFTFTMASTGDPSTFTFVADAFPGSVKGSSTKKVLYALQIME